MVDKKLDGSGIRDGAKKYCESRDQFGGIYVNPAGKTCKMYVREMEEEGKALLMNVPKDLRTIAFGEFVDVDPPAYFAFLISKVTPLKLGSPINGILYAEGNNGNFGFTQRKVEAFRQADGSYDFSVKNGLFKCRFHLFPDSHQESTFNGLPIDILAVYNPKEAVFA